MSDVKLPSHKELIEEFEEWEEDTLDNQKLQRRDRQYYDGSQWTDSEVAELNRRGQPIITVNRLKPKADAILGEEVRKRVDPQARPRTPQHEDAARAATDALRYVEEAEDMDALCGDVFGDLVIEGEGAALVVAEETERGVEVKLDHVPWDRYYRDPKSRKRDASDALYQGVVLWMDLEDAVDRWPDAEDELRAAMTSNVSNQADTSDDKPRTWVDGKRKRVKVCEHYRRIGRDWYRSHITQGATLSPLEPTGYLDDCGCHVCPIVAVGCYVDSENNRFGILRNLISLQDEINKRRSKALHLMNTVQVVAEDGAVDQPQKFMTELAKPDGFAVVNAGRMTDGTVKIERNLELAASQVNLLQEAKGEIDANGPSSANLPDLPQGASGRAFLARQQAASQEMEVVFSTFRSWRRAMYRAIWLRIRQFWTEEKWLRVTDDKELTGYRFVALNQQVSRAERLKELLEDGAPLAKALDAAAGNLASVVLSQVQQQHQATMQGAPMDERHLAQMVLAHPLMAEMMTLNQVESLDVDITIEEAPETASIEQEEFESLSKLMPAVIQARPDMAESMTKMLVQASQLRGKREILEAMSKPNPQAQQQQAMQQQLAQQMAQLQAALAQANVQKTQAQAALAAADTQKTQAETQLLAPQLAADAQSAQADNAAKLAGAEHDKALAMKHATEAGVAAGRGGE